MKNRFIVVYTIFAALVFVFSLSFFVYNLYREYHINQEKSEKQFNQLISSIKSISSQQEENTAEYAESIKKSIGSPAAYAFIELKRDNQIILQYPAGSTKQDTSSKMTRSFESTLSVSNKSITFACNYYLIHPDSIFYYARVSFLMILIITLITVIMIIYLNVTEKNSSQLYTETEEEDDASADIQKESEESIEESEEELSTESESIDTANDSITESEASENSENSDTSGTSETSEGEVQNENAASEKAETTSAEPQTESISEAEENTESKETPSDTEEKKEAESETKSTVESSVEKSEAPAELPVNAIKPAAVSNDNPSGLYNPDTEISWESYLSTRLDNEIDRATASEIDLSLFIFKFPENKNGSQEFKNICNYLTIQFQFKDLLFEFMDDSIVAIKISMDVDSALSFADKLYADIENIIDNKKCYIGITSRSIRIVTGERLMLEAEQAVEHAINDNDSPIIAFRVDSDKYRQMLEQH